MNKKLEEVLKEAVYALYFDDNNDYGTALWKIVEIAGGQEACDLLENNREKAFEKYCVRLLEQEEKKFIKIGSA